ncbi:histone H3.v1-like isoform X2 [Eriocheir sinensis]|uniref:histone H3.v1-like isoform X2 n=1 Tax=Eriocheir sinensis TaxID=95602 RepID=UPI0021C5B27F|nr:histone H3.v1-like isoform X2 [Eriocheir sinensis]
MSSVKGVGSYIFVFFEANYPVAEGAMRLETTLPNEEEEEEEEEDWEEDEEHRRNPLREQEEEEEEEEEEDTGIPWCRSLVKLSAGSH